MTNKDEQVELAKLAEQAGRYTDMVTAMKKVAESNSELTNSEHNLLSVAYKNMIGSYKVPWRVMSCIECKAEGSERRQQLVKEYLTKIESEMKGTCHELLVLLDKYLIPKATAAESKVFYLKMKGDYYRYLAEIVARDERQNAAEESRRAYKDGFDIATNELSVTDPIRLGLALHFSIFNYEILGEPDTARSLAKEALDDAMTGLDCIREDSYKDSTLLMQLLRDNITLWASNECLFDDGNQSEET